MTIQEHHRLSQTPIHHVVGVRYNGNMACLYKSPHMPQVIAARERKLNPRRWKFVFITQGHNSQPETL